MCEQTNSTQHTTQTQHKSQTNLKQITNSPTIVQLHQYRRNRTCENFLSIIEDSTDGVVSKRKCLAGQGQIELVGDEQFAKEMVTNPPRKKMKLMSRKKAAANPENEGDPFIALILDRAAKRGTKRVYRN